MTRRGWFSIAGLLLSGLTFWAGVGRARLQPGAPSPDAIGQAGADLGGPSISSLPAVIYIGDNFVIQGSGFTSGSVVNFFIATATGAENFGPLVPTSVVADSLTAFLPTTVIQGEGVASLEVVNTDEGHVQSNTALALLQGDPSAGLPSITAINGVALSPTSINPGVALANVETLVSTDAAVTLTGTGFDVVDGVGVNVFCDCPGGNLGPVLLYPGDPGLSASSLTVTLPPGTTAPAGPAAFQVTNLSDSFYASAAVSAQIGPHIAVDGVSQAGSDVTVSGAGFSNLTVINLFNVQGGAVVNLGGYNADGSPKIPLKLDSESEIDFTLPAGAVAGPAYVQALNPPFIPFSSSGNSPGGAFTAM